MRHFFFVVLCGLIAAGCSRAKPPPGSSATPAPVGMAAQPVLPPRTNGSLIVTPGTQITGRIASANAAGRFAIATFPLGVMPSLQQRLGVYRSGLKVGEIKITGPQRDINIAADIVAGDCRPGDEVRSE